MTAKAVAAILLCPAAWLLADDAQLKRREPLPQNGVSEYRIDQGRRIAVKVLSTISFRSEPRTDRVDLQTVFPVVVSGRMMIPAGSFVDAELVGIRNSALRTKGRIDFIVRLNRLVLPDGSHRGLHGCLGSIRAATTLHRSDAVVVPGTTTEVVLQDPIVFPATDER